MRANHAALTLWLSTTLWIGSATLLAPAANGQEKVSTFGRYEGWSQERFDGWTTNSLYVEMRDGVRLAVDVTRPTQGGVVTDEALPVVWTHSRYHRNPGGLVALFGGSGAQIDSYVDTRVDLQRLLRHGYVFCSAGVRGSGASFGRFEGLFSPAETSDAIELIEWFATQPWCDGNVGMWGGSYLGITQYMAASRAPEALKAIFPDVAAFDMYELLYPGGAFRSDMIGHWDVLTDQLDLELLAPTVDGDEDGELRAAAIVEHADNWQVLDGYSSAPFRDDVVPGLAWDVHGPSGFLEEINTAKVPCYHYNGWFDVFALDTLTWYVNYAGPQKAVMGPWSHAGMVDPRYMQERLRLASVEQHRWFDRWLKGVENGVTEGPALHYALMTEPGEWRWEGTDDWPPLDVDARFWAFSTEVSESVDSVNDGVLTPDEPKAGIHSYRPDPTTTTGTTTRWDNAVGATPAMNYPNLLQNDQKSLTYTSAVLSEDLEVVGHPVVRLWVDIEGEDADFVVVLEEVDANGGVHYVTEGVIRATHRRLGEAPWNNQGLPFQRGYAADREPLPANGPVELHFDLLPTANLFDAGSRVRVALFCADADNLEPADFELGTIGVHCGGDAASGLQLPILVR